MRKSIIMVTILYFLAFVSLYGEATATPVIAPNSVRVYTDNIGYNGFVDEGRYFVIRASITPSGSGTTANAQQGSVSYPLNHNPQPLPSLSNLYASRTPYNGEIGQWVITANDGAGTATTTTYALDDPQLLPLATNLSVSGPLLAPTLTWDSFEEKGYSSFFVPSFPGETPPPGYDFYMQTVSIRLAKSGMPIIYQSTSFYTNVTSYTIPEGILAENEKYLFDLYLTHSDFYTATTTPWTSHTENMSETFVRYSTVPVPESVAIDIKPGSDPNSINPKSKGNIPVAILSTQEFYAPEMVNEDSLTFGATGEEDSLAFCNAEGEDVNGDGLEDLVCHFYTQLTGFRCDDTEGVLKGMTMDGAPIEKTDSVRIVPCKK